MRTDFSFFDEFIFLRIQKLRNIDFFCYDCSIFEIRRLNHKSVLISILCVAFYSNLAIVFVFNSAF